MAIITFLSDFGTSDHYVAAVKAAIIAKSADARIVDISHDILPGDLGHASYVLKNVFADFPPGTIHLCAIDSTTRGASRQIAVVLDGHYFLGEDSGLFSLLSSSQPDQQVVLPTATSTFAAKEVLAPAAAALANGQALNKIGDPAGDINQLFGRQLKVTKREIAGNVIRVDHYGNLITNIIRSEFDTITKLNGGKPYEICFGRERLPAFHQGFHEVEAGDCFALFNSSGFLQIGINRGNASELLGIHLDAPVIINFEV